MTVSRNVPVPVPVTGARQASAARGGGWPTTLVASLGILAAYAPILATTVALPSIQRGLSASTSSLQWVSDLFVIPMAALILSAGVIGDVHGRRKVLLGGLGLTTAGAALALCAPNIGLLWAGEAIMGSGAAAVLPSSLAMIGHAVQDFHQRARHISVWVTAMITGMGIGGLTAGAALQHGGWRWAFLPCLILGAIGLGVAAAGAPDSRAPVARRLDWPGQVLGALAVCALIFGVIEGGSAGWASWRSVGGFAVAALAFVAFVPVELTSRSPMLDLRLFGYRAFTGACLVAALAMFSMIGVLVVLTLFFGNVQHLDGMQTADRFAIFCASQIVVGPLVGRSMRRIEAPLLMAAGLCITAGGMFWLTGLGSNAGLGSEALRLVVIGAGFGLVFTPMTHAAVSAVEHHHVGMAAAGINAVRQLGGALGPAVLVAVLAARTAAHLPTALAAHRAKGPAGTTAALADSMTYAMHVCSIVAAIAILVAAAVIIALRPRRTASH